MKLFASVMLIAALALAVAGQNYTDESRKARNAPDLFVLSVGGFGPDRNNQATYMLAVKNTGQKNITAVDWEYLPPGQAAPMKFRNSDLKIAPGARIKISKRLAYPGNDLVTQFKLGAIRIMRVEYEDGPAWQRPSDNR
ncbi:MAG TPA: hypothetical protein VNH22_04505 [Blastocatellia bacterium]|jgi:hypothetical protein|nr:hypothetical protein [Blastocatellia bacterium]